jgi:hypothetical protein
MAGFKVAKSALYEYLTWTMRRQGRGLLVRCNKWSTGPYCLLTYIGQKSTGRSPSTK